MNVTLQSYKPLGESDLVQNVETEHYHVEARPVSFVRLGTDFRCHI